MSVAPPNWDVSLSSAPELVFVGTVSHGIARNREHHSFDEWCLYFYKYEATLVLENALLEVRPGYVGVIPPGVAHEFRLRGRSDHLLARFALQGSAQAVQISSLLDLGRDFATLAERFEQAMLVFDTRPQQATARIWDLLWELSDRSMRARAPRSRRHAALDQACRVIQSRLSERLSLADLAAPAGVSPAHLTRLFRAELGVTATDYLRRCRLERALHLLTRSELPVKEVACEVGIPDLHAFNKAVRRGYGMSPRELRARGGAPLSTALEDRLVLAALGADAGAGHAQLEVRAHRMEATASGLDRNRVG
jgi:AraC-like DNA-binding protein